VAVINIQFHHLFHEEHVIDKSRRHFQGRLRTSRREDDIASIGIGGDQTTSSQLGRNYSLSATNNDNDNNNERVSHKLAGLKCQEKYGGPEDAYAEKEMAFWSDIPSDASYKSPFMDDDTERYLAFEPDHGGWNNIRSKFQVPRSMLESLYLIQL
jgi:hypothetical protein